MEIQLLDYKGEKTLIDIDPSVEEIKISVISGDMVMTKPVYQDSSSSRCSNWLDGEVVVHKEDFEKINTFSDSYDFLDWALDLHY